MSQGVFGGMTNYDDQSIEDIKEDISKWIEFTNEVKSILEEGINTLKTNDFWNKTPFNFQATLTSSIRCQNTILSDLHLIATAITEERLTKREIELMRKIGKNAVEYNIDFGKTFKEDSGWKEYDNKDFRIVEQLYAEGRDYFVTMQDASNVAPRLMDYINTVPPIVNQGIHQTVNGERNIVTGINEGSINITEINPQQFATEVKSALNEVNSLDDIEPQLKQFIEETLIESKQAIENGDLTAQSNTKTKMKGFIIGAGSNAIKLVNLLGTYSSIASYFEL